MPIYHIPGVDQLAVGQWTFHCCTEDLHEIKDQQDIDEIKSWDTFVELESVQHQVFASRLDALQFLFKQDPKFYSPNIQEQILASVTFDAQ